MGMLQKEGLISEDLIQNLLTWKNSGFSVYSEGKVVANDDNGRERLAKYMIRPPILMTRLTYDREKQVVYYRTDKGVLDFDPVTEIEILEEEEKEGRSKNSAWPRLIKKVYEISPLVCKQCGGEMKIISVITDFEVIRKILKHLGLWNQRIHAPPPLPNIHPPPETDFFPDDQSYFQDFIPSDDQYIVDQPFFS